ncbi:MAG: acyl-[acyl-carrier-protein]--UDP-N-acetylglucosamine O-acyltransferase, partial [Desulfobacterales bacterium]|nr:acyl-[acyl-carrier-protein]--UDP-N-acetylglucosamine O-acyltransferase [Desulfobacterales bacterium]
VIAAGDRATLHGLNNVGLKRHNFQKSTLRQLKKVYRIFFRIGLTVAQAQERAKAEVEQVPEVMAFMKFIKESNRGVTR